MSTKYENGGRDKSIFIKLIMEGKPKYHVFCSFVRFEFFSKRQKEACKV